MTFDGIYYDRGNDADSNVSINLRGKDGLLARIDTDHGFIVPEVLFSAKKGQPLPAENDPRIVSTRKVTPIAAGILWEEDIRPVAATTNINVYSPRWGKAHNVNDTTYALDKTNRLAVWHAPDETADTVIAQICDAVAHSKDHQVVARKLSKLNLPSQIKIKNVDALADTMLDQIRAAANPESGRVENTNAHSDREM